MSGPRVSDPSRLHLEKELTQIRKAARVLRDPGTTSSWKSPLNSSRSMAAAMPASLSSSRQKGGDQLDPQLPFQVENSNTNGNGKEKMVFLYNWKQQRSSNGRNALDDEDGDDLSSWIEGSLDGSMSDARNGGDTKSDTYLEENRSASMIFRCRDANLVSLGTSKMRRASAAAAKKKSKKNSSHLNLLPMYQHKEMTLNRNSVNKRRLNKGQPSLGLGRNDYVEQQSDNTEDCSNSEDLRKFSGASPFLSKHRHQNWSSSKLLKTSRKEDSSYTCNSTPAMSTSSYNRYVNHNPSTVGSWDATTASLNDGDDELDDRLDMLTNQGCGIPCYWVKRTPKHRGRCRSCCSPSFSDTLRRKGSSILCGSQSVYHRHRNVNKERIALKSSQGILPLLTDSGHCRGGSSIGTGHSDDDLSTNYGELDLEAQSRLDGRRWSASCRSQDGLEIVAQNGEGEEEGTPENIRSLSQKYKPIFFDELVGQNIVVQSLANAVSRGRIAPVYLFQGPRGTGKTSAARIFAAALNCLTTEETKPCGYCRECADFISGKNNDFWELDCSNEKGLGKVRYILKKLSLTLQSASSRYKVFVFDECHLLPSKTWLAFLKFLEDPPRGVVFIFITTDLDIVPRTIQSRCQKYLFNKIRDGDIVARLGKISTEENLEVDLQALDLIALNADGSLQDAETMLDQLSLLGKRITRSLVNDLVGVVSDEKLLELLELAMSSDTAETVKRARDLMDSGADPLLLMSQLASLIMDIISGTYKPIDDRNSNSLFVGQHLTEVELERLKRALKLLSEAEKQLRVSSERSTWFTATLLQLGSMSPDLMLSSSSRRQSSKTTEDDPSSTSREVSAYKQKLGLQYISRKSMSPASLQKAGNGNSGHQRELQPVVNGYKHKSSDSCCISSGTSAASHDNVMVENMILAYRSSDKLDDIWIKCIEKCHSKTLRQLLRTHGKLLSIREAEGLLVAYVAFGDSDVKSRAERFLSSITNSIEMVLRRNVELRIVLLPVDLSGGLTRAGEATVMKRDKKTVCSNVIDGFSENPEDTLQSYVGSPNFGDAKDGRQEIPMQRIESIIREQRLETAWLQAAEKVPPGSFGSLKPEKNQVLPQEGTYGQSHLGYVNASFSSQNAEALTKELKVLNIDGDKIDEKEQMGKRGDHYPLSPSLLHDANFSYNVNKDSLGYESGSNGGGCGGLFCWNSAKSHRKGKVKGTPVGARKSGRLSMFGECGKGRTTGSRLRR